MKKMNGFTLVELVIVIAIIGIIAVIALPMYSSYVERAACEDGKALLNGAANAMERGRAQNNGSYDANTTLPGSTSEFGVAVSGVTAAAYSLTATATGKLSGALTLDAANVRGGSLAGKCTWQ